MVWNCKWGVPLKRLVCEKEVVLSAGWQPSAGAHSKEQVSHVVMAASHCAMHKVLLKAEEHMCSSYFTATQLHPSHILQQNVQIEGLTASN